MKPEEEAHTGLVQLGRALMEAASTEPLLNNLAAMQPFHVALRANGHPGAVHIELSNGRLFVEPRSERESPCTAVLSPRAVRMLRTHPAAVLASGYMGGELRVEGDAGPLMALIALLEEAAPLLKEGSIFREEPA